MKQFYIYIILLFACFLNSYAQDPGFSQYYAAPMYLNPAYAGDKQDLNISINSRTFTNSQIANYNLIQISSIIPIETPFLYKTNTAPDHFSGGGISLYRESTGAEGELNTLGLLGTLAHSIQVDRQHYVALGLQGGCIYKKQGDNFKWGSQYSENFGYDPSIIPSVDGLANLYTVFPTFNVGAMYFYNSGIVEDYFKKHDFDAYAGIAVYNVNRPNQSFFEQTDARLPMHYKVNAGLKYHATKQFALFPTFLYSSQNLNNQFNFGMYANIRTVKTIEAKKSVVNIIAGLWYRVWDSYITTIGFTWYDFKFALSYDLNASNLEYNNRGKGATEVSLKYSIPSKNRGDRYSRGLMYPSF
mgnify:CR=1 FL=1|jgi:type IX secretion system PorP/SprF family membrane protein